MSYQQTRYHQGGHLHSKRHPGHLQQSPDLAIPLCHKNQPLGSSGPAVDKMVGLAGEAPPSRGHMKVGGRAWDRYRWAGQDLPLPDAAREDPNYY